MGCTVAGLRCRFDSRGIVERLEVETGEIEIAVEVGKAVALAAALAAAVAALVAVGYLERTKGSMGWVLGMLGYP